tara:strand:+ start:376 stop:2316 length:1941 start_codon:yes stop_codon:yes gene_type:complete
MGGLAGHMSHLYDNRDLKFGEMKEIFSAASQGELTGTEKTDGQNLFISYSVRDGKAKAARNKGNIKTGGMDAQELASKFADRGNLTKSFIDAFRTFEKAVLSLPTKAQRKIFGEDANIFYNAEIMDPRSANVINYDKKTLLIHRVGHAEFDRETGTVKDTDVSQNVDILENALERMQRATASEEYSVEINAIKSLKGLADRKPLKMAISRLNKLMKTWGLSDTDTVGDFIISNLGKFIDNKFPNLPQDKKTEVLKRLFGIKGIRVTSITKGLDDEMKQQIKIAAKGSPQLLKNIIDPLEDIVHDFSVAVLQSLESTFVLNNKREVIRLQKEVANAIEVIKSADNEKANEFLQKQLYKLKQVENITTAAEGFVFDYNGITYKFTGNFAPLNQILGLFKYGRADVQFKTQDNKPKKIQEQSGNTMVFAFGRFNPPTIGHQKLIDKVAGVAEQRNATYKIFASQTQNAKKNPLGYQQKIMFMKKMFPEHKINIVYNPKFRTVFDILEAINKNGATNVIMIAGSDRVDEFKNLLQQYNGIEYNFENIEVISAGQRDPDKEGAEGMSASKMRAAALSDDYNNFRKGVPPTMNDNEARELYLGVRKGMNIEESLEDMLVAMVEDEISETSMMSTGAVAGAPKKRNKKLKTNY